MQWLFFLFLVLASCEQQTQEEFIRPVKTIQLRQADASDNTASFPGTLRASKRANLSFRIDGTVLERNAIVGQKVRKGDILIQLDPHDYEVNLKRASGKVESVRAQLEFALRDYERMKNIYETDPGAISASFLDRKLETTNQLKGELVAAESDEDKAMDDLAYTSLKAPFDGMITAVYVESHEQVHAKQAALRIVDTSETEMEINVPERYIALLLADSKSHKIHVVLDALPDRKFEATVTEIGAEASSTTQTYPVTLSIKDVPVETLLVSGMSGKAIFQSQERVEENVFQVPLSAVQTDDLGDSYVWVVKPETNTVHKTKVKLKKAGKGHTALIEEGVAVGEWIVIAGTSFLSEGQKVKPVAEQAVK